MDKNLKLFCSSLLLGSLVACSDVKFRSDNSLKCQGLGESQCIVDENGFESFNIQKKFTGGKVDIIFINDNSASMSTEQGKIQQEFQNFISKLDSKYIDYRIGITTTDIESQSNPPREINQNGKLQNGRLITFNDNSKYLTPSHDNRVELFKSAIKRPETERCEAFIKSSMTSGPNWQESTNYKNLYQTNCPSPDERGIYAANQTVLNNYDSFFRNDSNIVFILLSDEDVMSKDYITKGRALDSLDQPDTLASNITSRFQNQIWNFHSIITLDNSCKALQDKQIIDPWGTPAVLSSLGELYYKFNTVLKDEAGRPRGTLNSICDQNYSNSLVNKIAENIIESIYETNLACSNPIDLVVSPNTEYTLNGKVLKFNKNPNVGTEVNITYKCKAVTSK